MQNLPAPNKFDVRMLDHIRVTSIGTFNKCPQRWVATASGIVGSTENVYSRIGTAVHAMCERYLKGQSDPFTYFEHSTWERAQLMMSGISEEEADKAFTYLTTLTPRRQHVKVCEFEFQLMMPGFGVPIRGHMDVAYDPRDGSLEIEDHKTNRKYEGAEIWKAKFQPRLYTWAARQLWPEYERIRYRIGYVNLGTSVEWETDADDTEYLRSTLQENWDSMLAYTDSDFWPATYNDECSYCSLKGGCAAFQDNIDTLRSSFLTDLTRKPLGEQYDWIVQVRKQAQALEEEIKAQLLTLKDPGPGWELSLKEGSRRVADVNQLMHVISEIGTDPELWPAVSSMLGEFMSAKVGGLDKLAVLLPQYKDKIAACISQQPNKEPGIKLKRVG